MKGVTLGLMPLFTKRLAIWGSGGSSADGSSGNNGSAIPASPPHSNIAIRRGNGYAKFNHEDKA